MRRSVELLQFTGCLSHYTGTVGESLIRQVVIRPILACQRRIILWLTTYDAQQTTDKPS